MNRLFLLSALSLAVASPVNGQALDLPAGPGKETTQKVCGSCHGAELMIGRQETRETWGAIVDDMVQRGAQGTPDEFYDVVDYLAKNFSKDSPVTKVNVNQLNAKELQKVLGLPADVAVAVAKYRDEKGGFKSIEELAAAPGINRARVMASKNRLSF